MKARELHLSLSVVKSRSLKGAFGDRKTEKGDFQPPHVCPSIRIEQLVSH
jgi:hypothetical protein